MAAKSLTDTEPGVGGGGGWLANCWGVRGGVFVIVVCFFCCRYDSGIVARGSLFFVDRLDPFFLLLLLLLLLLIN